MLERIIPIEIGPNRLARVGVNDMAVTWIRRKQSGLRLMATHIYRSEAPVVHKTWAVRPAIHRGDTSNLKFDIRHRRTSPRS